MAKASKQFRTIFFIEGVLPTQDEQNEIDAIDGIVVQRNVQKITLDGALEDFDFVAGAVPLRYAQEAERKAEAGEDAVPVPVAAVTAPAAPQKTAKPAQGAAPTAWKPN